MGDKDGLVVEGLEAFYGQSRILRGVDLQVRGGEVVALVGRNGAGKTTTLKSVMGLLRKRSGRVRFEGRDLLPMEPYEVSRSGIGYVPEGRIIFGKLSVRENIEICVRKGSEFTVNRLFQLFPRLQERQSNWGFQLSGGEQQMVAIARALAIGPKLVLLDEPSQGLAPVIVDEVVETIRDMKQRGVGALLVEQNVQACLAVADRVYVLDEGRVVYEGGRTEFENATEIRRKYLTLDVSPGFSA